MSAARRLKELGKENAKLKKLLAEQMLEVVVLGELLEKMVGPVTKREASHICRLCCEWVGAI
jgi:hypothetical protein